jgi:glycosyltransferase involved in cell wall biosynthesis
VHYISCDDSANELNRWNFKIEKRVRLTIVVATYQQELALDCLLKSLLCQTLQNFKVLIVHDGPSQTTPIVVEACARARPEMFEYFETTNRFNDFGHSLRAIGIERTDTEFILLTNGDNYYAPRFVEFMFEAIDKHSLDIAFCDMIHSYTYGFLRTRPFRNYIDLGCFIAKTAAAKSVGFRDKTFSGDATYFEDLLSDLPMPMVGKVSKVLMVHN